MQLLIMVFELFKNNLPAIYPGCVNLSSVVIPTSVSLIGYYAFQGGIIFFSLQDTYAIYLLGCKSLSNVTIPTSVSNIDENVFRGNYQRVAF